MHDVKNIIIMKKVEKSGYQVETPHLIKERKTTGRNVNQATRTE